MMIAPESEPTSVVDWEAGDQPRSKLYGDVYFSRDDGLAESRAVYLAGCGLPEAWTGRRQFTVGELGFGTGLNIAALLALWRDHRPPGAHLSVFSVEAHPLTAAEAARALGGWPELADIAALMVARWPGRSRGFHRLDLPELGATVDVAVMEAAQALTAWRGRADAWFLDGFSPALNPEMWRPEVMTLVGARSAPGARVGTYTVAGAVRAALTEAGFAAARVPGHGRKRQRLEARMPGVAQDRPRPRVAIIGAGVAGASLNRAFAALGLQARMFDGHGAGSGASGAPAGLMAPRLDAGLGPGAALFAQGARRAAALYEAIPGGVLARGALQLPVGPKDPGRFAAIAGSDLFEPGQMTLPPAEGPEEGRKAPLAMAGAVTFRPRAVLAAWLGAVERTPVAGLERLGGVWRLMDEMGRPLAEAEVVCVAAAMGSGALAPLAPLTPVRGQVSLANVPAPDPALVFGAYVIATDRGTLFGATHDRDDTDPVPRPADRNRNLAAVAKALPDFALTLSGSALEDWSAIRATTHDYLPLAGPVGLEGDGLWTLTGLGSRGFCLAPLLAEDLAARILGTPSPLPRTLADLTDPGRFAVRAARKGRPAS